MSAFNLWFPKTRASAFDPSAETAFSCQTAYICLTDPFDDGSGQHDLVDSKGHILLRNEVTTAGECCRQIDSLIADLKALKSEPRRKLRP